MNSGWKNLGCLPVHQFSNHLKKTVQWQLPGVVLQLVWLARIFSGFGTYPQVNTALCSTTSSARGVAGLWYTKNDSQHTLSFQERLLVF